MYLFGIWFFFSCWGNRIFNAVFYDFLIWIWLWIFLGSTSWWFCRINFGLNDGWSFDSMDEGKEIVLWGIGLSFEGYLVKFEWKGLCMILGEILCLLLNFLRNQLVKIYHKTKYDCLFVWNYMSKSRWVQILMLKSFYRLPLWPRWFFFDKISLGEWQKAR